MEGSPRDIVRVPNAAEDAFTWRYEEINHWLEKFGLPEIDLSKSKVLDVGSGDGTMVSDLRSHGIDAFGVEIRSRGENKAGIVEARIERLPFIENSFDVIIAAGVFHQGLYNQNQEEMLSEIFRVLKPNGVFLKLSSGDLGKKPDELVLVSGTEKKFSAYVKKL
ncbi:MAG: class I SAM-dependent methyltransferase [Candidatus Paceibacterota bacterium]|jgi:ubiquinone/menaquinone biosynthesis C-methylase UbiE